MQACKKTEVVYLLFCSSWVFSVFYLQDSSANIVIQNLYVENVS